MGRLNFLRTDDGWQGLILRVMLGVVMFPHGAQKLFGWFGGHGLFPTLEFFEAKLHLPSALTILVILAESAGAIALIFGLYTRIAALGIVATMIGAMFMVTLPNGFFMNWFGIQAGEGIEYHLLAIAMGTALLIGGGGRWSVDRYISERLKK